MQNGEQEFTPEELVPLALIALEADEPIELVADSFGADVVLDDIGMRSVPAGSRSRVLHTASRAGVRRMAEQFDRLHKALTPSTVPAGIRRPENADPTMSAYEVMLAADADRPDPDKRISPVEEFFTQRFGPPRKVTVKDERER